MNGAADLGGMMGFGPVEPEPDEKPFHAGWEAKALALSLAMGAARRWNIDASRHARESLPPGVYLTSSYYAIWVLALERLLVDAGLVEAEELEAGVVLAPGVPVPVLRAAHVRAVLSAGSPYDRPVDVPARFAVGDRVRTRNTHPIGHTRLPRYARARTGVVERVHGVHVLPDTNAHGAGEHPGWLYAVRFSGRELWGEDADAGLSVLIDAWDCYLEPVEAGRV